MMLKKSRFHCRANSALRSLPVAALLVGMLTASATAQTESYEIMAPAGPGGGTDQIARAVQATLQDAGIASDVQVVNVPGAGGTIGLAQFAENSAGDPSALIIGGYVMIGSVLTNNSPVTLADVTPIARLKGEPEAIVVPAASQYQTIDDLVEALKADTGSVSIAGGAAGGVDHILAGLLAQAAGVDPVNVNYIGFSGGGEALAALLGNQVQAGISGLSELEGQIASGSLRLLAVTSEERIEGVDAPTLKEAGYDVVLENWHMIAAAPGITAEEKAAITADFERMAGTEEWKEALAQNRWTDRFLTGDEFEQQLKAEIAATEEILMKVGLVKK